MSPLYYQEPDLTVSWDAQNRWVIATWRNRPLRETVRRGCGEIFDLMVRQQATAVLNDNRGITGTWAGASEWVADEWLPRMIASGLCKFAWIESPISSLSVVSAKRSAKKNSAVVRLFKDPVAAEAWLRG